MRSHADKHAPSAVQCGAAQYSTVQFSTVQFSSDQFRSVQFSAVQCSSIQFSSDQFRSIIVLVQFSAVQCSSVQFSSVQFRSIIVFKVQFRSSFSSVQFRCTWSLYGIGAISSAFFEMNVALLYQATWLSKINFGTCLLLHVGRCWPRACENRCCFRRRGCESACPKHPCLHDVFLELAFQANEIHAVVLLFACLVYMLNK